MPSDFPFSPPPALRLLHHTAHMKTYLIGRKNSTVRCDIVLPEHERSVSRKHLEMTVSEHGECYLVHIHPVNVTRVWDASARDWRPLSQQYVDWDAPLLLGEYQTTARQLLAMLPAAAGPPGVPAPGPDAGNAGAGGRVRWDPEAGTIKR